MFCSNCANPMTAGMKFCPACGKPAPADPPAVVPDVKHPAEKTQAADGAPTARMTEPPSSAPTSVETNHAEHKTHHSPRAKLWRTAAFTAIGAAGGYVTWAMFLDKSSAHEVHWGWDTWLLTMATIALLVLFVISGLEDVEHRLKRGHWGEEHYQKFRLGSLILKGHSISVVVAVAVHLYLSLVLHRPVIAVSWAIQFALFAAVTYAWLEALWHPEKKPSHWGAKAGARWGFWAGLIGAHLSIIIVLLSEGLPETSLGPISNIIASKPSQLGMNIALSSFGVGVVVVVASLLLAGFASVSMGLCGFIGGKVLEKFQANNIKWRLSAGVAALCLCNLFFSILGVFVRRMFPQTAEMAQPYDAIIVQFAVVLLGSMVGIWIAPPIEPYKAPPPSELLPA